jgi:hypothetical protein
VKGATNSKAVMITLGNCNKLASATAYAANVALSIPAEHVAVNYPEIIEISQCMFLSSSSVCGFVLYTLYGLRHTFKNHSVYCKLFHVKHGFI